MIGYEKRIYVVVFGGLRNKSLHRGFDGKISVYRDKVGAHSATEFIVLIRIYKLEIFNDLLVLYKLKDLVSYFFVKPSDVPIYVERGVADIGVAGSDILMEYEPDVYSLLDLGIGKCRICVAAKAEFEDDYGRPLRVATKFKNVASKYYSSLGRTIDIIKLNGSIELAPILGLADGIVDIVETGTTLKENDLKVLTEFLPISARFIANKASYTFKKQALTTLLEKLQEVIG